MKLETLNNVYEIVYFERADKLYNIYIQKTGTLAGTYKGEATYSIGSKDKTVLETEDVINLKYEIY